MNPGRDPTKPPAGISDVAAAEKDAVGFDLQSIIISNSRRMAIINNRLVKVGDNIGGAKVVAIERNAVVLSVAGRKLIIHLFKRGIWN